MCVFAYKEMLKKAIEEGKLQVQQRCFRAGTCLYRVGQPTERFYLLLEGAATLSLPNLPHDTLVAQGNLLGIQDLLKEQHSHTAILAWDAQLVEIPKQELLRAIQTMAPLRLYLMRLMSKQQHLSPLAYE